jgi:DNA-binding transcriptional ArsR family regulator
VLERAGLVRSSKSGRVRTYYLEDTALAPAEGWMADQRRLWEGRLDQLDVFLKTSEEMNP